MLAATGGGRTGSCGVGVGGADRVEVEVVVGAVVEIDRREEKQVSANPSSPALGLGLGRVGQGRAWLGLGCAIPSFVMDCSYKVINFSEVKYCAQSKG